MTMPSRRHAHSVAPLVRLIAAPRVVGSALAVLALALVVGGCGSPDTLLIVNRSDATLALMPGMLIAPCSQAGYSATQVRAAQDALTAKSMDGDSSWIPVGAVVFDEGWAPQHTGAPDPQVVVVSGIAVPRVFDGAAPAAAMPPCGGAPVGVSLATMP